MIVRAAGRARFWAATHEASGDGMASVGGDVAEDDRDDFGVGAATHIGRSASKFSGNKAVIVTDLAGKDTKYDLMGNEIR
jgi:hypothetical protein